MAKNKISSGNVISYTAAAAVSAGEIVVMGGLLGVAKTNIAVGESGAVAVRGVFAAPKVEGAEIGMGESLTFDVSAGEFDDELASAASGDITGACAVAHASAGVGDTSVLVMFTGVPGTVN